MSNSNNSKNKWFKYNPQIAKTVSRIAKKYKLIQPELTCTNIFEHHTEIFGSVKSIKVNKHKKDIYIEQGVIISSIRELAAFFKTNKDKIASFINELVEKGILLKIPFMKNKFKYAWKYIYTTINRKQIDDYSENKNNFENNFSQTMKDYEKINDSKNSDNLNDERLQAIGEKLMKKGLVIQRIIRQLGTDYYIKTKKEKERKEINTTTSISAREKSTDVVTRDDNKITNVQNSDKSESFFSSFFSLPWENKRKSQKFVMPKQEKVISNEEKEEMEYKKKNEIVIDLLADSPQIYSIMQLGIRKGQKWLHDLFFDREEIRDREEILKLIEDEV